MNEDDRIYWSKGARLLIAAHHSGIGKGLSYEAQEVVALEDGFSGGWDVWNATDDFSFYGFSVLKVLEI